MKRTWIFLIIASLAVIIVAYGALIVWLFTLVSDGPSIRRKKIALIRIEGVIAASSSTGGIFSSQATDSEKVIKQLRKADEDGGVGAILLRIDSPGGTAAGGEEIYKEVKRTKKPVVASVADQAASAGYLVASGADKIVANPASDVGSIGVIYVIPNYQELYKKIGIDFQIITQGKYKDMYGGLRSVTEEERKILEKEAKTLYEQFIERVYQGRRKVKITKKDVRRLATGQTWPGSEAYKLKLVDELGNYQDAVDLAKKLGKIKGKARVVEYGTPSFFEAVGQIFRGKSTILNDLLLLNYLQPFPSSIKN